MTSLDRAGRRVRTDWTPRRPAVNKGKRYPPDPPSAVEILAAVETLGETAQDRRLAALIALLWRAGLSLSEALSLGRDDCDPAAGVVSVRSSRKAARRRATMDAWGFARVARWREVRDELPDGPLLCVLRGPTAGRDWGSVGARAEVRRLGRAAGVERFAPQQLRYAHAAELLSERVSLGEAYRQLGLSTARNNRAPALTQLAVRGSRPTAALRPPTEEKILRRWKNTPTGEAYASVRRGSQAADSSYRRAKTRAARRAWSDALEALREAEEKILRAITEDYGSGT